MTSFETLRRTDCYELRRAGRFLVVELLVQHRVLSTSVCNGGQAESLRFLLNHQSCEGTDHKERHAHMVERGLEQYHAVCCQEAGLPPHASAVMGTAANMNYAAIIDRSDEDLTVTSVVTAGVQGNATCAGDVAMWRELEEGWSKVIPYSGTINTILLINRPLTAGALARCAVTMTEAKSTALQQLAVRSLYSNDTATGTGTDQYCIAAPLTGGKPLTSASTHVKLGELIGVAVRDATLEALRWQNGLEPSYTRSVFHALGRYGWNEEEFFSEISPLLTPRQLELLRKNAKSAFYEPLAAAAVYAFTAVLDRARSGTLPDSAVPEALRQQAASVAANLAAQPERWPEFRARLPAVNCKRPASLLVAAIALGWSSKWT